VVLSESDLRRIASVQSAESPSSGDGSRNYSGKLVHCGTAFRETFLVLEHYDKCGEDWGAVREAILKRNLLGKGSTRRARHVAEAIRRRFILSPPWLPPPRDLLRFGRLPLPDAAKRQVVLAYIAAEDHLFHDVLCGLFAEKHNGALAPRKTEIRQYAEGLLRSKSPPIAWSLAMGTRWAEGLLAVLRQSGLVDGFNPGVFYMPNLRIEAFTFLFLWLYESLGSARRSIEHRAFAPFFLEGKRVQDLLEEGRQRGWWGYTGGFGMIELTPKPPRLEDWMDDLEAKQV
jgi:hypothetical protein